MKSDVIVKKLKECTRLMKDCSLITKVVIWDQGFSNPGCKAYKGIRNTLYNNGMLYKNNEVNLNYIE